ncbi:bifunctional diguanylate cyclase/phosphodiesterase [Massilia sp. YIM B02443]|uniref:putative bifunctional diguanylate cyclase/phosphodiesterase n=1 Tax=Massilia sp. YIM B02443 TaxID=3050127 RepID=UPI0025B6588F|nr:EAL domain-containing protein [Massilia sp. YIM B02443]MDN4037128.1 EAL domain-containing protein [Massilia sp. YIM B02443]
MNTDNSDLMYRLLVQSVVDYAIYTLTLEGIVSNWNPGAQRAKGYVAAEIVGQHYSRFYRDQDIAAGVPARNLEIAARTGRFEDTGWRVRKDGSAFWAHVVIDAIRGEDGVLIGFAKITRDITERHQQQLKLIEAKELAETYSQQMASLSGFLDSVIANIPAGVLAQDRASGAILLANQQAQRLFGGPQGEMTGRTPRDSLSPEVADYLERQMAAAPRAGALDDAVLVQTQVGPRSLRSRTVLGKQQDGSSDYVLTITEDVTDELAAYAQIHHMAQHDGLTNLPNRHHFNARLEGAIEDAARCGEPGMGAAILCIDLDNFKNINDAFGHGFGDKILLMLANRLRKCLREQDTLARLGGDEFAVVLPRVSRVEEAQQAAQRLIDAVAPAFSIDGHSFAVGISVGIALSSQDAAGAEQLLQFGDMALYEAKRNGRHRHELFRPELEAAARVRRQIEIDLRRALHRGELYMAYQPIVEQRRQRISGYEALIRWRHPDKGLISPLDFIPVAEETGLIHEIGARALNLACQEAAGWSGDETVAVNLSPLQFKSTNLVDTVALALADSGLAPQRLELEITESVMLDSSDANVRTLRALKALGVRIALDDFGTGYSSLSYLRSFPFDKIKIDKSFVQEMDESREAVAIIRAITGLSGSLLIETTAEGVETEGQFRRLEQEGCTHFQGYLFGRPEAAEHRKRDLDGHPALQ